MKTPIDRITAYIEDPYSLTRDPIDMLKELRARIIQDEFNRGNFNSTQTDSYPLDKSDLEIFRQWFNCIYDAHNNYLNKEDYKTAVKLHYIMGHNKEK